MKLGQRNLQHRRRLYIIISILALGGLAILIRTLQLGIFDRKFLQQQGNARSVRNVNVPALRGMITDRNGYPLAITTPVESVWIDPQRFIASSNNLSNLAKLLNEDEAAISKRLKDNEDKEFIYLKRHILPDVAEQIRNLQLKGVHLQQEYRRYYPEGEVTAQLLGFTNIDDQGQEGEELAHEAWLRGTPGKQHVIKDGLGRVVTVLQTVSQAKSGNALTLSIDRRIQYAAYRELKKVVEKNMASSGTVIVLDSKTGEVLAMVNQPSFNPNVRPYANSDSYRNRALTDLFEPGSTIKPFSVANALQNGDYTPQSMINTSPGWLMLDGNKVRDVRDNGTIDVGTILKKSSNVGVAKLTLSLPEDSLSQLLHNLGFGELTTSGFPGEAAGKLALNSHLDAFSLATLSFGYGLSVTALQLAQSYAVLASLGVKYPVTLLKRDDLPPGQRVISAKVAQQVLAMLEQVASKDGTARRARIAGYRVAGKTGTVRMVGPNGYEKDHHIALFVGIAPVSSPSLVVVVIIRDPKLGKYYGGVVAAPVFKHIMAEALHILEIAPDA